jgi:hypothetical protein
MDLDKKMATTMEKTPDWSDHVKRCPFTRTILYVRRLGLCQFALSNAPQAASRVFLLGSYAVATCPRLNYEAVVLRSNERTSVQKNLNSSVSDLRQATKRCLWVVGLKWAMRWTGHPSFEGWDSL